MVQVSACMGREGLLLREIEEFVRRQDDATCMALAS